MTRRGYIHLLFCLLIFSAVLTPIHQTYAQGLSFTTGEKLQHSLSVCLDKPDAIEIAEAFRAGGREAAEAVWQTKSRCQNIDVLQGQVGKVVYAVKGLVVVEIVINGKVEGYFVTSAPVNKAQRNT